MTGQHAVSPPSEQRAKGSGVPATLIGKTIAHGPHVVTDCCPFGTTDDAYVFDGQNGEEQVLVGLCKGTHQSEAAHWHVHERRCQA